MSKLIAVNLPYAGLGNRMRFTLSAAKVASAENRHFSYFWPTSHLFEPSLTDLWDFPFQQEVALPQGEKFDATSDLTELRHLSNWVIQSHSVISLSDTDAPPWEDALAELEPVDLIKKEVEKWRRELPEVYIGVSIRANNLAHQKTIEHSPVEWYEQRMSDFCQENPEIGFFVSCDVPEIQARLESQFPNVIGVKGKGKYNSTRGVQSAVVDLYLLSQSNHILAPYWSSFPYLAYALSGRSVFLENSVKTIRAI